jgi:hypothetical protein
MLAGKDWKDFQSCLVYFGFGTLVPEKAWKLHHSKATGEEAYNTYDVKFHTILAHKGKAEMGKRIFLKTLLEMHFCVSYRP